MHRLSNGRFKQVGGTAGLSGEHLPGQCQAICTTVWNNQIVQQGPLETLRCRQVGGPRI